MAATVKLEIVTPESTAYSGVVEFVTLPASEGEMGVYPNHIPLMAKVDAGELVIRAQGQTEYFAVGQGFVQILGDRISILTDMAVDESAIDEERVEEAKRQAEARLQEKLGDEEAATVTAALANSIAQLRIKRRRRGG